MNGLRISRLARPGRQTGLSFLLVAFSTLAIFYSLIIPLFEGPDEDDHFRYAKYISDHRALPVQEFREGGGAAGHQGWQPPLFYSLVAIVISPIDTTDYMEHLWRNEAWAAVGDPSCCGRNIYYHTENESFPFTRTTLAVHLARLLAVLFGAVTVAATAELARTLLGDQRSLIALAAGAIVAFNPSFLFASALVSNDTMLAALSALVLLFLVRLLTGKTNPDYRSAALLGALLGLALLVKTTAFGLIPFSLLTFGVIAWRRGNGRLAALGTMLMLAVITLLAGWWFVRNQALYGDPLAYRLMTVSALFPRSGPLTLPELLQISLPWMWQTLWGGPTPGDFSPLLLVVGALLALLGLAGTIVFAIRNPGFEIRATLALLATWLGTMLIAQVQFIRTTIGADQGRYLFPAISVLALFMALGLTTLFSGWLPTRGVSAAITLAFLLLALFVPAAYTLPAYGRPALLSLDDVARIQHPMDVRFQDQLQFLGYDLEARTVKPGDTLHVTLYWRALARMSDSYRVFVHLIGDNDTSAGGVDVIPARGSFPTLYWQPDNMLRDVVTIPVAPNAPPGKYDLEIGLYPVGNPSGRLVADTGQDAVRVHLKVAPRISLVYTPKTQSNAIFGDKIRLLGYDAVSDSGGLALTLYWQALKRSEQDYKVFVHLLDASGKIVAQQDQQPQNGGYPTSLWDPGEQVRDEHVLSLPPGIDNYRVEIGLYLELGERLPVQGGDSLGLDLPGMTGQ